MADRYSYNYNPSRSGDSYHLNFRKTLHEPIHAKTCYFYKDNDYKIPAAKVAIHPKRYKRLDNLLSELTRLFPALPFGVRSVRTPRGCSLVSNVDALTHEGRYICSTSANVAKGLDVGRVCPPEIWHQAKPQSGQRKLNRMLREHEYDEYSRAKRRRMAKSGGINYSGKRPKKITLLCNGDPSIKHLMLLNRKTAQTFDQVLKDMSEMFDFAVRKLYTIEGRKIGNLMQLFNGPDLLVVTGQNEFKIMSGFSYTPVPPRGGSMRDSRTSLHKRRRIIKSRGRWKVTVVTGDDPSASTSAQVTITIYGQKSNTGPINLGSPDNGYFESGAVDDFEIFAPGISDIFKVRVAQDGTGSSPAWFCEEVKLTDMDTGEEIVFPCNRWMDNEQGDLETCRELPVTNKNGESRLQVVVYEATVTTGDLWNSGTDANVYMTIYGDRGDTGVRQLIPQKHNSFKQGESDTFQIEAVQLGRLKRIIIGHDGTGAANGWNLERILVNDPIKDEVYNFYCGRWLDEGEDDGKIVREIQAQVEYMGDVLEKKNWDCEKWKFENKNQVKIISELTGKCLRIKGDGSVDGNGEFNEEWVVLNVAGKKNMIRTFGSLLNKNYHIAIDNGKTVGHGKGGAFCEFRIHVQHDLSVLLESVKYPLQFITLADNGRPTDPRGVEDDDSSRRFLVYCKGMFRNRGVIMLRTSKTQTIAQDSEEGIYGTGKLNRTAHFKVHKVSDNGVRMFESVINPGRFIRLKHGQYDCQGGRDESSHFIVRKFPDKGYVTVESAAQRGLFIGLTTDGVVKPTVDTGGKNVCLYPEVVEFGIPKRRDVDLDEDVLTDEPRSVRTPRTPKTPKTPKSSRIEDGTWKVIVSTAETLQNGGVSLVAYGDEGNTGPITLAGPAQNGPIFQNGSVDEFTANLTKAGKLFKIRLEVDAKNKNTDSLWKVREVKMEDLKSKEIIRLTFNRWLSPIHDDGSLMRELPVVRDDEEPLPVLKYQVTVFTGKEKGAATQANVYINFFGENGDCGKRVLHQADHVKKFQPGQKDVFEVEGVSLGQINKCLVGHDSTNPGEGWFLDKIVVKESADSKEQIVFKCNKWLDSGKEDRKIERELAPVSDMSLVTSPELVHNISIDTQDQHKNNHKVFGTGLELPQSFNSENTKSPRPTSVKVTSNIRNRNSLSIESQNTKSPIPTETSSPVNVQSKYPILPPITSSSETTHENNLISPKESESNSKVNSFESQELDSIQEEEENTSFLVPNKDSLSGDQGPANQINSLNDQSPTQDLPEQLDIPKHTPDTMTAADIDRVPPIGESPTIADDIEDLEPTNVVDTAEKLDDNEDHEPNTVVDTAKNLDDNKNVVDTAEKLDDNENVVDTAEKLDDNEDVVDTAKKPDDNKDVVDTAQKLDENEDVVDTAEKLDDNKDFEHNNVVDTENLDQANAAKRLDDNENLGPSNDVETKNNDNHNLDPDDNNKNLDDIEDPNNVVDTENLNQANAAEKLGDNENIDQEIKNNDNENIDQADNDEKFDDNKGLQSNNVVDAENLNQANAAEKLDNNNLEPGNDVKTKNNDNQNLDPDDNDKNLYDNKDPNNVVDTENLNQANADKNLDEEIKNDDNENIEQADNDEKLDDNKDLEPYNVLDAVNLDQANAAEKLNDNEDLEPNNIMETTNNDTDNLDQLNNTEKIDDDNDSKTDRTSHNN